MHLSGILRFPGIVPFLAFLGLHSGCGGYILKLVARRKPPEHWNYVCALSPFPPSHRKTKWKMLFAFPAPPPQPCFAFGLVCASSGILRFLELCCSWEFHSSWNCVVPCPFLDYSPGVAVIFYNLLPEENRQSSGIMFVHFSLSPSHRSSSQS